MDDCLLCKGSLSLLYSGISSSYSRAHKYSIGVCTKCQLHQTLPRPTNKILNEIYSKVYAYELHEAIHPEKSFRAQKLANMFGIPDADSIAIEIGCGEGILLKHLQSRGVRVFGCELDKKSVDKANQVLGDNQVFNLTAENFLQEVKVKPDYIFISHTLEHFENPLRIMKSLHGICGPNTKVIIAVPNVLNVKRWFFPRKWGYWQVPIHITHFSKDSLNYLLREAGFQSSKWVYRNSDILTIGNFWLNFFNLGSGISKVNQPFISLLTHFSRMHSYTYLFGRNDLIVLCKPK
jgi:2-polyprenyl-3-methyl-5-hydroxy-6-metoxy-1,4-benzoquinol methylase